MSTEGYNQEPNFALPAWQKHPELIKDAETVELEIDEYLFKQGDVSEDFYLISAGALTVHRIDENGTKIEIDKLFSGDIVGEIGLLSEQVRTATVQAMVPTRLLKITSQQYARLQEELPEVTNSLLENSYERWQRLQLSGILANLFGEVDVELVHDLQHKLIWKNLAAGDVLCRQNDVAQSMYFIINGRMRIDVTDKEGNTKTVGDAGTGETIGEYALLTDQTRSASVIAARESVVAEMTRDEFQVLSRDYPQIIPAITKIIVERQQRAIGHISNADQNSKLIVTLIPVNEDLDMEPFVKQLEEAISPEGATLFINAAIVDSALRYEGVSQSKTNSAFGPLLSQWMSKQEANHDYLILLADPTWTEWTQRCIRMSDRLMMIGQTESEPSGRLTHVEKSIKALDLPIRQDFVFWHPASTEMPEGTSAWLSERPFIAQHHHIRDQDPKHFSRLMRSILGKSIGLVFSGGGARGYVQLGVLKAMDELGIPVDYLGGTSFGGIMASFPAQEKSVDQVMTLCDKFSNPKFTQDRTIPLVALNKSAGLVELLTSVYEEVRIEDLWIPFFTLTSNISTAESVIIDSGPLWLALRKTIAIPGVYSPIVEDGHVFVDGGIMNNFPLDVMSDRIQSQRMIGVSISPLEGKKRSYDIGHSVSGWRLLWNRINPLAKKKRVPSLGYVLLRTMEVNSLQLSRKNLDLVDLFLAINPNKYGFLDFAKYREIIDFGYESSLEPLKTWKESQTDLVT